MFDQIGQIYFAKGKGDVLEFVVIDAWVQMGAVPGPPTRIPAAK
jgi:hypothetical protein